MTNQSLAEMPVLQATEQAFESINLDDKLQVAYIECKSVNMPEYFRTDKFTIQFMIRGTLTAEINHQHFTIHAPAIIFISPNYILHPIHVSEDSLMYVLSFSIDFGNDMNLNAGNDIYNKAYIRPVMSINENQLNICLQYLSLLRNIIQDSSICNSYKIANSIVRSLIYYMADFYVQLFNQQHALTRAEEHAGRFLSLVDIHSHAHHNIKWYASEMCLSPQYMANIVKQVTGRSAGECITENLIQQARSLLITTSLSIQEIADQLGFKNQSHFGTFFHRAVGMSPKAFRMKNYSDK